MSHTDASRHLTSLEQLSELCSILDEHSIIYWLDSGTLLGVIREGSLLANDTDIDLSVWNEDAGALERALPEFADLGYSISTRGYRGERTAYVLNPRKNASKTLRPVDLKIFRKSGEYAWRPAVRAVDRFTTNRGAFLLWRLVRGVVRRLWLCLLPRMPAHSWPLRYFVSVSCWWIPARLLKGTSRLSNGLCVPSNTEEYLQYRYGEWRIPVSDWHYRVDDPAYVERSPEELLALAGERPPEGDSTRNQGS